MGGFNLTLANQSLGPIDYNTVIDLITRGELLLLTNERIDGMSKTTCMGKTLALINLGYFLFTCIYRLSYGLPLAHLEVMVLAQVVIAILLYGAWWHKLMSVDYPVQVSALRLRDV